MENEIVKENIVGENFKFPHEKDCPHNHDKKCQPYPNFIEINSLARAYIPSQKMCEIYSAEKGLKCGTIYPELDKPYSPEEKYKYYKKNLHSFEEE